MSEWHLLRPLWLLALVPLAGLLLWRWRRAGRGQAWRQLGDPELVRHQWVTRGRGAATGGWWLLALTWLLVTLGLAGPSWERLPQTVSHVTAPRFILLDLSGSMAVADLAPDRLVAARRKLQDLLDQTPEGRWGLIGFSDYPYRISPLTQDHRTVQAFLQRLSTELVPTSGSRPARALELAAATLRRAEAGRAEVVLVSDGIDPGATAEAVESAAARLRRAGHRVSVWGMATPAGGPVPAAGGGYQRDAAGELVVSALTPDTLQAVAEAGGGVYIPAALDGHDVQRLAAEFERSAGPPEAQASATRPAWKDQGHWLVVAALPLAALLFRRGWLAGLVVPILLIPPPAAAWDWADLWQRPAQQAAAALRADQPAEAAAATPDPRWRGAAYYRQGDFASAADYFARAEGAVSHYNRGNALARSGQLAAAAEAYQAALEAQPAFPDARHNYELVRALLESQGPDAASDPGTGQGNQGGEGSAAAGSGQRPDATGGTEPPESANRPGRTGADADRAAPGDSATEPRAEALAQPETGTPPSDEPAAGADATGPAEPGDSPQASSWNPQRESEQAAQQWLEGIEDDPAGLLRRQIRRTYERRYADEPRAEQPW